MITILNDKNQEAYSKLFEKACQDLKIEDPFTSLDEYFAHMGDLLEIDPKYMLLPLDEEPFEIDANSRSIKVPSGFAKCASVQDDANAEMIVFTIDRFFDFIDLDTCSICVQWIAPSDTEEGQLLEGISFIDVRDLETLPGKIRFGWLLTERLTRTPGKVQFAVRFYKGEPGTYTYVFNTLPAQIEIKPSLQIGEDAIADSGAESIFKSFITNSQNPSYPVPQSPSFIEPGLNLPETANLVENALTLKAQAVIGDLGNINYKWYHAPEAETLVYQEISGTETFEPVYPVARNPKEIYYVADPDKGASAYKKYNDEIPAPEGTQLYERFTTYTLPAEGSVTGRYLVKATNTVSVNTTSEIPSQTCQLLSPSDITIVQDLPHFKFIEDGKTELFATVAIDERNPQYSYIWSYSDTSEDLTSDVENKGSAKKLEATEAGWYQVAINSTLNRETKTDKSAICHVVNHAETPVLSFSYRVNDTEEYIPVVEDTAEIKEELGADIHLKVNPNVDVNAIKGNALKYIWQITPSDATDWREIDAKKDKNIYISGIGTPELVVNVRDQYNYRCIVENTVYNETVTSATDENAIVISIIEIEKQ